MHLDDYSLPASELWYLKTKIGWTAYNGGVFFSILKIFKFFQWVCILDAFN